MTNTQQAAITSPDLQAERLNQLKRLMPDLFDGEGNLDEAALRGVVNPDGVPTTERFRFEWAGKQQSKRAAFTPSKATLIADPTRSVDFDGTQNLIIEGDNLEVLKLLQTSYNERVKCIYIDPPYNTGNDFIYPDDFSEGKKAYWQRNGTVKEGVKLTALPESHGRRHSLWLNMMQSRLLLARQLLREDGVIFISIDKHEQDNLKKVCDEIFGESNFIGCLVWRKKEGGGMADDYFATEHEYIVVYRKGDDFSWKDEIEELGVEGFNKEDKNGRYKLVKLAKWGNTSRKADRPTMHFPILFKNEVEVYPIAPDGSEGRWRVGREKMKVLIKKELVEFQEKNGVIVPYEKIYYNADMQKKNKLRSILYNVGGTGIGTNQLTELFEKKDLFENPKPTNLLKSFLQENVSEDDIIMDFFAGSGTTAHAVMELNAQDGGNRRHILVQVPEYTDEGSEAFKAGYKTISSLCIERVKRAGEKIRRENPDAAVDTGFRVYRLTDSHFPQNFFAPDPNKTEAENVAALEAHLATGLHSTPLLPELSFADVVTEIALKNGYGVFHTLERLPTFTKNAVYQLQGNDKAALLCLDPALNDATVEALEAHSNEQLIVSSYALDTAKKWVLQQAYKDNLHVV